jgi:alkanesulfonate monooxygenase SsuD/methylene tetrahydromethanopterin reductase-like flavin-dependent oxidoreductase (luciferase family)
MLNTAAHHWGLEAGRLSVGISLGGASTAEEWQRVLAWVDRAEGLALHSVWIPEMHFAPGVATSPLLVLAACAARSRRLRLGTTSLLLPIRPPLRVAEEVAALDRLSQGRLILGLGRGFRAPLFDAFGIDVRTKRDRFDSALDLMLKRWAGEPVSLLGTPFDADDDGGSAEDPDSARPLQAPHPPLAVAAFGRKGLLQAARRALPYLASPLEPLDLIEENLAYHRENLPADARSEDIVVPVMRTVYVASTDAEAARVYAGLERETRASRRPQSVLPKAIARAAQADVSERVIVGTRNEVFDHVARYRDRLGMNLLIARPQVANVSDAEREASLERLADLAPELSR